MVRPKNFETDAVLHQVADAFSTHGYEGTSMAVLCEVTGLGKQSLYNSFGDKETLYCKAIDASAVRFGERLSAIEYSKNGRDAVEIFFSILLGLCVSHDPSENNCIVSAGLLEGVDRPQVNEKLTDQWKSSRIFLKKMVLCGQRDGSIRNDLAAEKLADLLMALMSGLRVSARARLDKNALKSIAELGLSVLTK
jgi:TetR/AcrR family transcriptional regulator, transcriptional repressor for nem operon